MISPIIKALNNIPKFVIGCIAILCWLVACSEPTETAGVSGTQVGGVSGKVLNEDDLGQGASQVVISQKIEGVITALDTMVADSLGNYLFTGLEVGEYSLSALTADGLSGVIESVQVNADQITEMNIYVTLIIIQNFNIENIDTKNEYNITQILSPSNSLSQVDGQWVLDAQTKDTIVLLTGDNANLDTLYLEVIPVGDEYAYQIIEIDSTLNQPKDSSSVDPQDTVVVDPDDQIDPFDPSFDSGNFIDERDDQEYPWVRIGEQIWMSRNLNYKIANAQCYENLLSNCFEHGRLYLWVEAMAIDSFYTENVHANFPLDSTFIHQGICPQDWHLPTRKEWIELAEFVKEDKSIPAHVDTNAYDVALYLNSQTDWTVPGYDTYGFNAKASGYQFSLGTYNFKGTQTYWWAADEKDRGGAYTTSIFDNSEVFYQGSMPKFQALSIRCVKD